MKTEFLISQLNALKTIEPDPVFLRWSRRAILAATPEPIKRRIFARIMQRIAFPKLFFPLAATGIATLLIIITSSETIPKQEPTGNPTIASLNQETILKEEQNIIPEHKLTEVAYYKNMSPAINLALNDIIDPDTNWKSGEHIKQIAENHNNEK